ncbi:26S proteasome regulatory subunit 4-like [Centruroides vittatus]|uniref:26S proteasome regulatory subunit 4-like n=1 Tax=Centruroides vittatus TaxID=120091 RepID=UPI00350F70DB
MERIKDYLMMEEEFLRNQQEYINEKFEEEIIIEFFRDYPLVVGELKELFEGNFAIVSTPEGEEYVPIMSFVDKTKLQPDCSVLLNNTDRSIVGIIEENVDPVLSKMIITKIPFESYDDIGGLENQIREIKEVVELPLTHPEYFDRMGITPPKGVILYGPPGTGKTLLAKAVANQTSATFLRVAGSELIRKHLGEGAKIVRKLFQLAQEYSPSIVFIDEVDAIGSKRFDACCSGEREVQRIMLELLTQLDGFDPRGDVKVVLATNRIESLDPALIRPGRIDRKIEFFLPSHNEKRLIFQIHTARMNLADDCNLDDILSFEDDLTGADIKALCTEAGLTAVRNRRMKVLCRQDFIEAKNNLVEKKKNITEGLYL